MPRHTCTTNCSMVIMLLFPSLQTIFPSESPPPTPTPPQSRVAGWYDIHMTISVFTLTVLFINQSRISSFMTPSISWNVSVLMSSRWNYRLVMTRRSTASIFKMVKERNWVFVEGLNCVSTAKCQPYTIFPRLSACSQMTAWSRRSAGSKKGHYEFAFLTLKVLNFWKFTRYCSLKPLWVGHGGSSAGSYLADPTSPIPSHCALIVATSTVRVNNESCLSAGCQMSAGAHQWLKFWAPGCWFGEIQ